MAFDGTRANEKFVGRLLNRQALGTGQQYFGFSVRDALAVVVKITFIGHDGAHGCERLRDDWFR